LKNDEPVVSVKEATAVSATRETSPVVPKKRSRSNTCGSSAKKVKSGSADIDVED